MRQEETLGLARGLGSRLFIKHAALLSLTAALNEKSHANDQSDEAAGKEECERACPPGFPPERIKMKVGLRNLRRPAMGPAPGSNFKVMKARRQTRNRDRAFFRIGIHPRTAINAVSKGGTALRCEGERGELDVHS